MAVAHSPENWVEVEKSEGFAKFDRNQKTPLNDSNFIYK